MVIKKILKVFFFFSLKKISYFRPDKSLAKGKQLLNRSSDSVIQGQRKHQSMSFRGLYNEGGKFKSFKTLPLWLRADCQRSVCSTPGLTSGVSDGTWVADGRTRDPTALPSAEGRKALVGLTVLSWQ